MSTEKKTELVAKVAYLLGVSDDLLATNYEDDLELIETLKKSKPATIIRYLSQIRTILLQNFKNIDSEMKINLSNLDRMDYFNHRIFRRLEEYGVQVIKVNYSSEKYTLDLANLINDNINDCSYLFSDWERWDLIKNLFVIPKPSKKGVLIEEFNKYHGNMNLYPYQMYIYWEPQDAGNILLNDLKFLKFIHKLYGEEFDDFSKCHDADEYTKSSIYDFLEDSNSVAFAVDCENSDVFKLVSMIQGLNDDELDKVKKIVLFDDYHTTDYWDWMDQYVDIPVVHIEVERIMDSKSLVDIKLTAEVCNMFYKENISSFILISSDSDYWGLISSLPEADFLIMYENLKCSPTIRDALYNNGYNSCSLDDFYSGNIENFKNNVILTKIKDSLPKFDINGKELVKQIYRDLHIDATDREIEVFYNNHLKNMRLKISPNGDISLILD